MNVFLRLLFLLLIMGAAPPRRTPNAPTLRQGRDLLVIDDVWRFQTDPQRKGETAGWSASVPDTALSIRVPSLWNAVAPEYKGAAWYWRTFDAPAAWRGQIVRLQFGAVASQARVWLNGTELAQEPGGDLPDGSNLVGGSPGETGLEFNVTPHVKVGAGNLLAVRVEGDARRGAGLWQGVLLAAHDEAYLADCFPQPDARGNLNADITLRNTSRTSGDATLDARIIALDAPTKEVTKTNQNLRLTPGRNQTSLLATVKSKQLRVWTPDTPVLYGLQLVFRQDKDILDTTQTNFGFRVWGFKNGQITCNGAPFTPVALAPDTPLPIVIATTEDTARLRDLLRKLKAKGVNVVYFDAPPPTLLKIADEEGMLVVEGARSHDATVLRALVRRDRAHACILAWNLGAASNAFAHDIRKLDPTRFLLLTPDRNAPQANPTDAAATQIWPPNRDTPADTLPAGLLPPQP